LQTVGLALAVTDCKVEVVTVFVTRISANEQTRDSAIYTTGAAASITCSATCTSAPARRTLVVVNRDREDDSSSIIDVPPCL